MIAPDRVRRALFAALALVWAGGEVAAQNARVRVRIPGHENVIAMDSLAVHTTLPATPAEVFPVAAAALELELKIPLLVRDSAGGIVGNHDLTKLRSLGGSAMSRYVSCGSGMTGPNADNYRVHLAIFAFVDPLPGNQTRLGVALAAGAQDVQGVAKQPVACGSTGALEGRIRRVVAAKFGVVVR
jgi:hypothetical protein